MYLNKTARLRKLDLFLIIYIPKLLPILLQIFDRTCISIIIYLFYLNYLKDLHSNNIYYP